MYVPSIRSSGVEKGTQGVKSSLETQKKKHGWLWNKFPYVQEF